MSNKLQPWVWVPFWKKVRFLGVHIPRTPTHTRTRTHIRRRQQSLPLTEAHLMEKTVPTAQKQQADSSTSSQQPQQQLQLVLLQQQTATNSTGAVHICSNRHDRSPAACTASACSQISTKPTRNTPPSRQCPSRAHRNTSTPSPACATVKGAVNASAGLGAVVGLANGAARLRVSRLAVDGVEVEATPVLEHRHPRQAAVRGLESRSSRRQHPRDAVQVTNIGMSSARATGSASVSTSPSPASVTQAVSCIGY